MRLAFPTQVRGLVAGVIIQLVLMGTRTWVAASVFGVALGYALYRAMTSESERSP